ncbi:MAG: pyridoxamine 5'-phosphate oxidase [Granulosicoccaceae bacterium]
MNDIRDQRGTRNQYGEQALHRADLTDTPLELFGHWLAHAKEQAVYDYNAMTLATADTSGQPAARVVLLKHFDERGYCWYTDRNSHKGQQLADNPKAALLFFWPQLHRQIRLEGDVEVLSDAEADAYFDSRPGASKLSAAVSLQSQVVADRQTLVDAVASMREVLGEREADRPERWGGYRLKPNAVEFWQGRDDRLHDRFRYERRGNNWNIERLCP